MKKAAVIILIKDRLILAISRKNITPIKYGLIGGAVEDDEDPTFASIREAKEECGVQVNDCQLIFEMQQPPSPIDGKVFYTFCYLALDWENIPIQQDGEGELIWMTVEELCSSNQSAFPDYNCKAIQALKNKYPNIELE